MKMLIFLIIQLVFGTSISSIAQTIVIGTGTSIYVPSGSDICSGDYGNITGNIYGEGTQCDQSPVPVELTAFTASVKSKSVHLAWRTETEINNYGFEILRKSQNDNWIILGFVEGNGNSNSPKVYKYTDSNPTGGSKYSYRLKQIDNDGTYEYSDIVEVEFVPTEFALYQNYPNPFNPSTLIKYQLPVRGLVTLKIFNALGQEVVELVNETKPAGNYEVEFDATNLQSGIYFYRFQAGDYIETKKMVLMK